MSDKKVLSINMDDFSFSNNKTKKSQPKQTPNDKIRVKNPVNRKQQTLRKQSLLNMIRKQQEDREPRSRQLITQAHRSVRTAEPTVKSDSRS